MSTTLALRLTEAAVWPVAVQQILARTPALRDVLTINQHLDPQVVADLAAQCDRESLPRLLQSQRHGLDGLRTCLRRAHELYGGPTPGAADEVDFEVAWALLHGDGPHRVRELNDDIANIPTGSSTAILRCAAGVDRPILEILAGFGQHERALWLASPAGGTVSDDDAWEMLIERSCDAWTAARTLIQRIAAVMLTRPALRTPAGRVQDESHIIEQARELLRVSDLNAELDAAPRPDRVDVAIRALGTGNAGPKRIAGDAPRWPWQLAQISARPEWTDEERERLAGDLYRPEFVEGLGWLAPRVAADLGVTFELPSALADQFTWEGNLRLSPDVVAQPVENPAALPVRAITAYTAASVTRWLQDQLDDVSDTLTAERWRVVLSTVDEFAGTVGDLVEAAVGICAPAH